MEKKRATRSRDAARRLVNRRGTSTAGRIEADAYLAAKETLRRIARSSQLAALTAGAVTIDWLPGRLPPAVADRR
jgi:hypothetical protein